MDIYAVEKQAGCYLANELEKLRKRRCNSRVAVKCSPVPANNDKINRDLHSEQACSCRQSRNHRV